MRSGGWKLEPAPAETDPQIIAAIARVSAHDDCSLDSGLARWCLVRRAGSVPRADPHCPRGGPDRGGVAPRRRHRGSRRGARTGRVAARRARGHDVLVAVRVTPRAAGTARRAPCYSTYVPEPTDFSAMLN